jgi:hypothetical protein
LKTLDLHHTATSSCGQNPARCIPKSSESHSPAVPHSYQCIIEAPHPRYYFDGAKWMVASSKGVRHENSTSGDRSAHVAGQSSGIDPAWREKTQAGLGARVQSSAPCADHKRFHGSRRRSRLRRTCMSPLVRFSRVRNLLCDPLSSTASPQITVAIPDSHPPCYPLLLSSLRSNHNHRGYPRGGKTCLLAR